MILIIIFSALALFIFMHIAFVVGTALKNNGVIDSFYGLGYVVVAWTSLILMGSLSIRHIITTILVSIWGFRLFFYVTIRNWGESEDYRYQAIRKSYGDKVLSKSYVKIYLFQGLIIFLVGFPALFINSTETTPTLSIFEISTISLLLGVIIWIMGFYFESVGDYQLRKFKKNPENKGQVMDQGLWKYTQHPNYFGEVTMWWGIFIIALGVPWGIVTIFGPILITYMIIKVSGVRLLNYRYRKDDKYADYKRRTSAFIPWFPKKKKE